MQWVKVTSISYYAHWGSPHPSFRREDVWEAGTLQPMEHPEMLYLPPSLPGSTPKKPEMVRNPTEGNLPDLEEMGHHELVDLVKKLLVERASKPTSLTNPSKDATVAGHVSVNQESLVQSSQAILQVSWPENQGILFFYISQTLQMNRISFMAFLLNAVL